MTTLRPAVRVRALQPADRPWAAKLLTERWGSTQMVTRGVLHDLSAAPGWIGWQGRRRVALLTYRLADGACEILSLDSIIEHIGVGTALLAAIQATARAVGCARVWLITTNENLPALRFYRRRGYTLAALYPNALAAARALKPQIPLIGLDEIPLRDEIALEKWL